MSLKLPPEAVFSVGEFLDLTNQVLKPLQVTIQGEVTSVSNRGHVYFAISDKHEQATLSCAIWKSRYQSLDFDLVEGMEVQMVGTANVYKPTGRFTFIADKIAPVGEGALKKAFKLLHKKLDGLGYFDEERKQSLPQYPQTIGLITSKNGDAIKDFRTHAGTYGYTFLHYDVRVEGLNAISSIVRAIEWFNQHPNKVEVLVLTRGGGSLESLQAFNSEEVARAIFASRIPVISAVGHENDVTIADLVADVRASTPTHAGKIISAEWSQAQAQIDQYHRFMVLKLKTVLQNYSQELEKNWRSITSKFQTEINQEKFRLANFGKQFLHYVQLHLSNLKTKQAAFNLNFSQFKQQLEKRFDSLEYMGAQLISAFEKQLVADKTQLKLKTARTQTSLSKFKNALQRQQKIVRLIGENIIQRFQARLRLIKQKIAAYQTQLRLSDPEQKLKQGYSIAFNGSGQVIKNIKNISVGQDMTLHVHQGTITSQVKVVELRSDSKGEL